jgi:hypothetical protein
MKLLGWLKGLIPESVSWWVPYWFHLPFTWRMARLFFASKQILRISVLSIVVGGAIVAAVEWAVPLVVLPPWWKLLLVLPGFYAYAAVMVLVHAVIPSQVKVCKKHIHIMTGQSHWVVKAEAIRKTRIVVFRADRIRLRVWYERKGRTGTRTAAIGRGVDLRRLSDLLPIKPQVWDARRRYEARVRGKQNVRSIESVNEMAGAV